MTGLNVTTVNVHVTGVQFVEEAPAEAETTINTEE